MKLKQRIEILEAYARQHSQQARLIFQRLGQSEEEALREAKANPHLEAHILMVTVRQAAYASN
jgi:hypothetical protein